jgi:hypothetical protein
MGAVLCASDPDADLRRIEREEREKEARERLIR